MCPYSYRYSVTYKFSVLLILLSAYRVMNLYVPNGYKTLHTLSAGLSNCHCAWAFHSEAEEELLNMLPALQKEETTWPELRSMGVGWWLRSTNKLRRCIEKVRQLIALASCRDMFISLCSNS